MTRRAKLQAVFEAAAAAGVTTADLAEHCARFKETGGSGLESYVNQAYADFENDAVSSNSNNQVKDLLTQALNLL